MNYQLIPAPRELAHLVRYFWTLEMTSGHEPGRAIKTFVDDSSGIIFHHHGERSAVKKNGNYIPQCMIYGQATIPSLTQVDSPFNAVGVLFRPHAIHSLFKVDASYFSDRIYALSEFSRELLIQEKMLEAQNTYGRIHILKDLLLKKISTAKTPDKLVSYALQLIKSHQAEKVSDLVKSTGVSERQLQRRFLTAVGVSPRHYIKVERFKRVVNLLRTETGSNFSELAWKLEFSDQPHFNKLIKSLSGLTPRQFKHSLRDELLNLVI